MKNLSKLGGNRASTTRKAMTMAVPCGLRLGYNAVGGQVLVIF